MGDTFYPRRHKQRETETETEMRFRVSAVVLVLVASVSSAPQWSGLKSLVKTLSGDDKPGEVNGDYEQIPYEVVAKFNGYEERIYPSVMYACTEMTYDAPDDEESEEWSLERAIKWMTNKKSWKDRPQSKMFMKLFRYIAGVNKESQEIEMTVRSGARWSSLRTEKSPKTCVSILPKNSNQTTGACGSRGEATEEQGKGRLRQTVWRLHHARLRLDE